MNAAPDRVAAIMVAPIPPKRVIVIRPFDAGFQVAVEPRFEGDPEPTQHDSLKDARGFAGGISLAKRWSIEARLP